ncbi:unnamed protein product, partial [Brassica rapa]
MMKRPIEEVYGCDAAEGFKKGKKETVEHYRALLHIIKADGKFDL